MTCAGENILSEAELPDKIKSKTIQFALIKKATIGTVCRILKISTMIYTKV